MTLDMHREDVKAALRKRYGTVRRFTAIHNLPATSVSDFFRGRTSQRVEKALEKAVAESMKLDVSRRKSKKGDAA